MAAEGGSAADGRLPRLQLDEVLDELQSRIDDVRGTRDRVHSLLEAVLTVGRGLELQQVLRQIVEAAVVLVDAEYGALGVVGEGEDGGLAQFIPVGFTEEQIAAVGAPPCGRGILGVLIHHPEPLRLDEISEHPESYGFPPNHPPMHTFVGTPIRVRDEIFGNLYLTEKRGGKGFDAEDEAVLRTLAVAAGVAIENARLYEEAHYRQQWLAANAEIISQLLSGAEEADVLGEVVSHARRILGADLGVLALPENDGAELRIAVVEGGPAKSGLRGMTIPRTDSFLGAAAHAGVPVRSTDLAADPRAAAEPTHLAGVGPAVAVPMMADDGVRGVLLLARKDRLATFTEFETQPLLAFAGQAAIAMELAERRREADRLVVYEDRDRIARDLHDLAIQRLFASGMSLQSLTRLVTQPEANARMQRVVGELDETIKIIRSTIFGLRAHDPGPAEPRSLRLRVAHTIEDLAPALGFTPATSVNGPVDTLVSQTVADQAEAVLKEALSNVARHAGATRAEVTLTTEDGLLTLAVTDDGRGIPATGRRSGLRNLDERARALGGTLTLSTPPNGGTRLEWCVPVSAD
ncbi:GAF domain-containing protein [Streptomyces sp. A7024]|uniref:GAF domain-containing protein n=1 Tax=Streptomyces coryli TaxID=1128680 RepID=A0A6G4U8B6_9ACTN|nr:GAF domain-containing protein [Streptomyces coryli]NGN67421.1 GAF domain-containing protein [Streptomyces coryli]